MAPRVGKDIVSYCKSCKMDLVHTVVALDGEKVVRVLCRTCNKEHAFRTPAELRASPKKRVSAKRALPPEVKSTPHEWEKAMDRMTGTPAKAYTLEGCFEAGEKVDHRTFGLGIIKRLIPPDKMEVLFEQGLKVLVRGSC